EITKKLLKGESKEFLYIVKHEYLYYLDIESLENIIVKPSFIKIQKNLLNYLNNNINSMK
ncbi:unnamed protein product, partial [marine sediment metagenome]